MLRRTDPTAFTFAVPDRRILVLLLPCPIFLFPFGNQPSVSEFNIFPCAPVAYHAHTGWPQSDPFLSFVSWDS
jgi:hypothetical protein